MLAEIIEFAKTLNKKDLLPSSALKRNSVFFPLVTYINHTIALLISEEYDNVALFIRRADKEIEGLKMKNLCQEKYFIACEQYLQMLSYYLLYNRLISESCNEFIPDRFK